MTNPKPKIKSLKYALRLLKYETDKYRWYKRHADEQGLQIKRLIAERKLLAKLAEITMPPEDMTDADIDAATSLRDDILAGRRI